MSNDSAPRVSKKRKRTEEEVPKEKSSSPSSSSAKPKESQKDQDLPTHSAKKRKSKESKGEEGSKVPGVPKSAPASPPVKEEKAEKGSAEPDLHAVPPPPAPAPPPSLLNPSNKRKHTKPSQNWQALLATLPDSKSDASKRKRVFKLAELKKSKTEEPPKAESSEATAAPSEKAAKAPLKSLADSQWGLDHQNLTVTKVLGLDCEMVGVGDGGAESVLAHVCVINEFGAVIYNSHVQTVEKVVDYRTKYSGVQAHHLRRDTAKPFAEVQREVANLVDGKVVVGHSLDNDFRALLLKHPWHLRRDTARYRPLMRGKNKPHALRFLTRQILGLEIQTDAAGHDPAEDARAALLVYKHLKKDWERAIKLSQAKKGKGPKPSQLTTVISTPSPQKMDVDSDGSDSE